MRHFALSLMILSLGTAAASAEELIAPAFERFKSADVEEVPDFRRHVVPLLGKQGCNSRACHGSFQGQGGFRLSLFGYDFELDHEGLIDRVDVDAPEDSYALHKPLLEEPHRGGRRLEKGAWEYNVLLKWIGGGAKTVDLEKTPRFEKLEVTPSEIQFKQDGEAVQLNVIAVWSDGSREDVTCLCRFQTNDEVIADIDKEGTVTSHQAGDTNVVVFYDNGVQPIPVVRPVSDQVGNNYPQIAANTKVDKHVVTKLRKLGIVPSDIATDAEFLRRLSLDMTGTLPTPAEIKDFVADNKKNKRAKKVDELLERPAYAAWWATRFADWTGNSDDQLNNVTPVRSQAARDWYEWLRVRLEKNTPYDEIAEGFVMAGSREDGESYREYCERMSAIYRRPARGETNDATYADRSTMPHYWARGNFRTPEDRAISFAYNFLGTRIQCAQCHKHPFDQWTMQDFHQFKNFFTNTRFRGSPGSREESQKMLAELGVDESLRGGQLRRELGKLAAEGKVVPFDEVWTATPRPPRRDKKGRVIRSRNGATAMKAKLLGEAEQTDLTTFEDPRQPLMDWLRNDEKQLFAKAIVNRVWANYFNVGIVNPPDDLALANPPSNAPLLDYLTQAFVENSYDLKWLHREITNSDTYQRSFAPNETNRGDERNFSRAVPRRIPAEVVLDAIASATASDEEFDRMVAEIDGRYIAQTSAGSRYNENPQNYALSVFGRSIRESNCDCDRSEEPSLLQTVFVQNDQHIYSLIDRGRGGWLNQVANELDLRQTRRAVNPSQQANAARQIRSYRSQQQTAATQLKKAKNKGDDKMVAQLERRIASIRKRIAGLQPASGEPIEQQADPDMLPDVIRDTYLRTLSREPSEDELSRSMAYVESTPDQLGGVRDLLWALVNTKEFIINH